MSDHRRVAYGNVLAEAQRRGLRSIQGLSGPFPALRTDDLARLMVNSTRRSASITLLPKSVEDPYIQLFL
jgi:hypothetical protein